MRAAFLAVGSELLGSDRAETNSLRLAAVLRRHGVDLVRKAVVGDEVDEIARQVTAGCAGCDLLLVTGGLGPTSDDLTREGVAAALGRKLERRSELVDDIAAKFRSFGMEMPEVNRRQADVVGGAEVLPNRRGTAPGQRLEAGGCTLFLLPGVPRELDGMVAEALEPWLEERFGGEVSETRYLKVSCLPESTVEERLRPFLDETGGDGLTILASPGDITVSLTRRGEPAARRRELEAGISRLAALLGPAVYGEGRDAKLEAVVGEGLRRAGRTVVTAESCTGGLVAERLTAVAGSSDYFLGAVVPYADRLKREVLAVPGPLLAEHGAVSEPVVRAMAESARRRLGADYAIAVSGVAGPSGGSEAKPVGTVHLAVAGPRDGECDHRQLRLPGDRARVRRLASQWALELLRRRLAVGEEKAAGA